MPNTPLKQFALAGGLVFFSAVLAAAEDFKQGMEAFRAGDYRQALRHFETARQDRGESANLLYNMAVTHYRLRQYGDAERLFTRLMAIYPEWSDLARYNLGLIALRRGDDRTAERYFRRVRGTSNSEKLVYLAGEGLKELNVPLETAARPGKKWFTLLSVSGGYDDNAIAFPDQLQTRSSQGEDFFVEALAFGQAYLWGDSGKGVRVHGSAYTKQYTDLDVVDVNSFTGGVTRDTAYNDWDIDYGAGLGYSEVDGDELTTQVQGRLKLGRSLGRNEYTAQYRPIYHDAGSTFPQLDGWQHRLDLRWRHRTQDWRWTVRYRFEYNDRDDLTDGNTFLSYSPIRNGILLEGDWYATPVWTFTAGAEYTNNQYDGENRLTDIDGVFKEMERDTDEIELWAGGQYELSDNWRVLAEYRYNDNDDNFQLYQYSRNEIKLSIEFTY